jgi:hypothetical protein
VYLAALLLVVLVVTELRQLFLEHLQLTLAVVAVEQAKLLQQ